MKDLVPAYWKLILAGVIAALVGVGIASWLSRGAKIDRLEEWKMSVVLAATNATVPPDKSGKRGLLDPNQVVPAIMALQRTNISCASTLETIDRTAVAEKTVQAKLDAQLSAILESQDKSAESTKARITDLLTRQATGDREKDCSIMDADSNAAWDGWRK